MKRFVLCAVVATCFAGGSFAGGSLADAAPSVTSPGVLAPPTPILKAATPTELKAFRKLYAQGDAAAVKRDVAALVRVLSDDFRFFYQSGLVLEKSQYVDVTTQILRRTLRVNAARTRIDRIGTQKNLAVVIATSTVDMVYRGLDEKTHRSVTTSQVMDTWVLLRQGWRVQSSQEIASRSTVDGRAYPPVNRQTLPKASTPKTSSAN